MRNQTRELDQLEDLLNAAEAAAASAARSGRPLTARESEMISRADAHLRQNLDGAGWLERRLTSPNTNSSPSKTRPAASQGPIVGTWRDAKTGESIKLYSKADSIAADIAPRQSQDGPSWGDYIVARVTGNTRLLREWSIRNDMAIGTDGAGAEMVPTPLSAEFIDLARAKSVVAQTSARTIRMPADTLDIARATSDPTAAFKSENAAATASDVGTERVTIKAGTVVALVPLSVELFEDAPNAGEVVQNAATQAVATLFDRAALIGSGTAPEIKGLVSQTGISAQANDAVIANFDPFSTAVQTVWTANGTPDTVILHPREMGRIDRLKDTTNQPLRAPQSFQDLQRLVSTQLRVDLGTGNDESEAIVGDFTQFLIGMRTNMKVEISREAGDAFKNLQVLVRVYLRAGIALAHPAHFVHITGLKNS